LRSEERELKGKIEKQIQQFQKGDFLTNAENLFTALGYASERRAKIDKDYLIQKGLNQEKACYGDWQEAGLIYQVTGEDMSAQSSIFQNQFEAERIQSYLFYAIELTEKDYPRGALAQITRYVNKLYPMPVFILFKYGEYLTLAIIDRRPHKKEESKDVLEKVTLIRNIYIAKPHRAHLEILFDLSYQELSSKYKFSNFEGLHQAWQKTLDTKELNKKFYRELSAWYFYAKSQVLFPDDVEKDTDKRNSINLIRLITRLIFVWFIKEKELIPEEIFDEDFLKDILDYSDKTGSTYYKAILQNLFFATLNLEMNKDKPGSRAFVTREDGYHSQQHLMPAYRYARFFKNPDNALALFENIPFLNGGLFENLDFETEENSKRVIKRIDCFSDDPGNETRLKVPDTLFFSDMQKVDLNSIYEDKKHQSEEFRGIINIFERYKFTIEENTPIEEEIALDPELLGKVFENLLASYNPETHTTARKATGSFYTPREIVDYMVDESLVAYLETQLKEQIPELKNIEGLSGFIRDTLSYTEDAHPFSENEVAVLINAIDNCKILDPACGSGAFPMGILHKLVYLLHKLDQHNEKWMQRQIEKVQNSIREAEKVEDTAFRENLIHDLEKNIESIEDAFLNNELDYGRKLYLIENCIYGVDIQPIAIQIAKLRFFISLVIDQKVDPSKSNLNIRALPNLETKFVAANTLIGLNKPKQVSLRNPKIDRLESELKDVRKNHFSARSRKEKIRLRSLDEKLRNQIASLLIADGWFDESARQLAYWNPYDQNASGIFFDPEWMFGIENGFDILIANPPYVRQEEIRELKPMLQNQFECFTGTSDLFVYFYEKGIRLLRENGVLVFISSNKYFRSGYGKKLRAYLESKTRILQVIDFGDAPIFNAIAYPSILATQKADTNGNQFNALSWRLGEPLDRFQEVLATQTFLMHQSDLTVDGWRLENQAVLNLLEKLRNSGKPLYDFVEGKLYSGVKTGLNEAFVIDRETHHRLISEHALCKEILKPFLRGRDVKRWNIDYAKQYLIKIESSENVSHPWTGKSQSEAERVFAKTYPSIYNHFKQFRASLINREDQGKYYWELRSCAYWAEFQKPKIIYPDIAQRSEYAFDVSNYYLGNTMYLIPAKEKWLLAILNSRIIFWFYTKISSKIQSDFVRWIAQFTTQIPIAKPNAQQQKAIEKLVGRILAAKRVNPQADTTVLEQEIDRLVYELYGLTEEEIAVVESKL